jgi:hypothetical protein
MPDPAMPQLADWGSFYVIIGSAAAGLTGLMFVVITLGAEAQTVGNENGLRAFVTPTVVHFCIALVVAVYMSSPGQTVMSIGIGNGILGVVGLLYVADAMRAAGGLREYQPVGSDWLWHGGCPILAYTIFLVVAVVICTGHVAGGLKLLAADTMFILLTAIHNAWDAATWVAMSLSRQKKKESEDAARSDAPGTA